MLKRVEHWSVAELRKLFVSISFPEYQREPNVWSRNAKQRLIDSMVRNFDIASVYLYENDDGSLECVDGRQRLNAIMSFLGANEGVDDNGFSFRVMNEIYQDESHAFDDLSGKPWRKIRQESGDQNVAQRFIDKFEAYKLTVVKWSKGDSGFGEFNLQFTRLNLGTIVNSGERLNAMIGDMRKACFERLGKHAFLQSTGIPGRRYSREQLAAQIVAQVLARRRGDGIGSFATTRHSDLQRMFKIYREMDQQAEEWISEVDGIFDVLQTAFTDGSILRNRAMVVSTVLLADEENVDEEGARGLAAFVDAFGRRLRWQVAKG